MYYILYDLKTLKVEQIYTKPLTAKVCDNFYDINGIAEYHGEIPKNDWLTVTNVHEEIEIWKEKQTQYKTVKEIEPQEQWGVVYEEVTVEDENGNPIQATISKRVKQIVDVEVEKEVEEEVEIEKSKTHIVCDLVSHFYPKVELTEEQKAKQKEKQYYTLTTKYIRQKYDADAVEALLANYAEDKEKYQEEFNAFAMYRKECKTKAYKEVYGV